MDIEVFPSRKTRVGAGRQVTERLANGMTGQRLHLAERGSLVVREPTRSTYMATARREVDAYWQQIARVQTAARVSSSAVSAVQEKTD